MSQLLTLIWLKWTLFRNSLRSSKAVANRIATVLGMGAALALALLIALGVGLAAYNLTVPGGHFAGHSLNVSATSDAPDLPSAEFIFFSMLTMFYLLWASLPLSIGSSRQFDPGNLLLYPISLRKLFAVDFLSEIASVLSIFAIPAIIALSVGAGLAQDNLAGGIVVAFVAVAFGLALSKWISTSVGSLVRKKQTRGETLLALVGVVAGLGGALFGQIAPMLFRHADWIPLLRWTPPGAIAYALTGGLRAGGHAAGYALALVAVSLCTAVLVVVTYWLSRRAIVGSGRRRRLRAKLEEPAAETYTGWELPLISPALSAVVEKELRYVMRNAQVRMMTLMPLILVVVRLINRRSFEQVKTGDHFGSDFWQYGEGLLATGGMLYVFLILAGLFCNLFAFEGAGMRTLILSPGPRKTILLGKNIALAIVALIFSAGLLLVNELVFRDLTAGALLFVVLSFFTFLPLMAMMGNWLSIRFPKRMKFGKRSNVAGVVGLLLIPMIFVLATPPLAATAAGVITQSLLIEYATLAVLAVLLIGFYLLVIDSQGESLQRREREILEAVSDPGNE
jgi:heme exporter protein D